MRLNPFNPNNIKVRRGGTGGGGRMPGGKMGCGGIVVVLIGALVFGLDPAQMMGTMEQMQGAPSSQQQQLPGQSGETAAQICDDNQYAMETCAALSSLNETWQARFTEAGLSDSFQQPTLVFLAGGQERTGCGVASSAMGPFYCPADQGIYIDTRFYDQLANMARENGDFARLYVVAHEYAHHVQTITGLSDQIRSAQAQNPSRRNQLNVVMELHADCYAGVWAGRNRNLIERGDFEEGMRAAAAIGDDRLMAGSGRAANPESFTHGSSEQRMAALRLGIETGDDNACDREILGNS